MMQTNMHELQKEYPLKSYIHTIASKYNFRKISEKIGIYSEIQEGMKVLDIGVGNGLSSYYACKVNADVYAIDFFKEAIDSFLENTKQFNNKNMVLGDALSLPFKDNCFDRTIAYYILHHMPTEAHRNRFIDEMKRVTANDGSIIIGKVRCRVFWRKQKSYKYIQFLSIEKIEDLLKKAGLLILDISHSRAQRYPNLFRFLPLKYFGHAIDIKAKKFKR